MDDLIDRQAAIDAMFANMPGLMFNDVLKILRTLPSAQPEREAGRWLPHKTKSGKDWWKCSECGAVTENASTAHYCYNCGVRMQQKTAQWVPVDSLSAFGGDAECWYAHGNPIAFWYCSECREQNYLDEDGKPLLTKYCPDCGARMTNVPDVLG